MAFIDESIRNIYTFIDNLLRIIAVVCGWIRMLRAICSALYLITSRLMILASYFYRIFSLLSMLLEPVSHRTMERGVRAVTRGLFDFYSSGGACYTLQARTRHVLGQVRARWRQNRCVDDSDDIYYDAFDDESLWASP